MLHRPAIRNRLLDTLFGVLLMLVIASPFILMIVGVSLYNDLVARPHPISTPQEAGLVQFVFRTPEPTPTKASGRLFGQHWKESFVPVVPGFWFSFKTAYNEQVTVVVDSIESGVVCQPGAFSTPNDTIIWLRSEMYGYITQDHVCVYEDPVPGQPVTVYRSEEEGYSFWVRSVSGEVVISFCTLKRTSPDQYEFGYVDP